MKKKYFQVTFRTSNFEVVRYFMTDNAQREQKGKSSNIFKEWYVDGDRKCFTCVAKVWSYTPIIDKIGLKVMIYMWKILCWMVNKAEPQQVWK